MDSFRAPSEAGFSSPPSPSPLYRGGPMGDFKDTDFGIGVCGVNPNVRCRDRSCLNCNPEEEEEKEERNNNRWRRHAMAQDLLHSTRRMIVRNPSFCVRQFDPQAVENANHENDNLFECPICYYQKCEWYATDAFPCTHLFCTQCAVKLADFRCPLCRAEGNKKIGRKEWDLLRLRKRVLEQKEAIITLRNEVATNKMQYDRLDRFVSQEFPPLPPFSLEKIQ